LLWKRLWNCRKTDYGMSDIDTSLEVCLPVWYPTISIKVKLYRAIISHVVLCGCETWSILSVEGISSPLFYNYRHKSSLFYFIVSFVNQAMTSERYSPVFTIIWFRRAGWLKR
jgi:hypothetical protein